jgi:crotonobetainyl-CoA:carnitine CoA-transferase CaiB-like acyl-CoA transferase
MTVARDAPVVGADTVEVLQRVAGLSTREIDDLAAEGVIEIAARKRC